jgi:hypothetical protein
MAADVVDMIMQDYREVERLFDELRDSPERRPNLVLGADHHARRA